MKRALVITCILSCIFSLVGCAGVADWASLPLPGSYEVWRISSHNIVLCMPDEDGSGAANIIDSEIYAVAYNEHYICVQQETSDPEPELYTMEPHGELYYYILCVDDGSVAGPYSENEFKEQCKEKNITSLCDWTDVRKLERKDN